MILKTEQVGNFIRTLSCKTTDKDTVSRAKALFQHYKETGAMKGEWDDDTWILSNELSSLRINFSIPKDDYEKGAGTWSGCKQEEFIQAARTYMALQLGDYCLPTLAQTWHDVMKAAVSSRSGISTGSFSPQAVSLLCFLPNSDPERDRLLSEAEDNRTVLGWQNNSRMLADLDIFMEFESRLKHFYRSASKAEKIEYFPVYLWVNLTFVLPLRPTEFTLIPRDCIRGGPGSYTITVRRTLMKKRKQRISYRVDGDYEKQIYPVPDFLAREILWFQEHSRDSPDQDEAPLTDQLFGGGKLFSYARFRQLLRNFIIHCIDYEEAADRILPGCARHLAMIGLIMAGGTPDVCRVLAGHETVAQASWYYANLASVLQGYIMSYGMKTSPFEPMKSTYRILPEGTSWHPVEGGKCDAMEVAEGNIRPCLQFYEPGRRPDSCSHCPHFYPHREKQFNMECNLDKTQDSDISILIDFIDLVRSSIGAKETLAESMERLTPRTARILDNHSKEEET